VALHERAYPVKISPFDLIRILIRLIRRVWMKGVWFSVCAVALAVVGLVTVAPSIARAAGLSRAEVLAEIVGRPHGDPSPVQNAPLQSAMRSSSTVARTTAL
jgi:hypothetical protein